MVSALGPVVINPGGERCTVTVAEAIRLIEEREHALVALNHKPRNRARCRARYQRHRAEVLARRAEASS